MSRRARGRFSNFCNKDLIVLLDMDQVLADFEGYFLKRYKERFPNDPFIPLEERKGFFIRDQYAKLRDDLPDKVRAVYNEEGFFRDLPEIEGAVSAALEMSKMEGLEVFLCSSPLTEYQYCLTEKFEWIEKHLGPEFLDYVILTKDKTVINGHILIDDRPRIKGSCKSPIWEHIVFNACHNLTSEVDGKRRLNNWTDGKWRDIIEDFKKRI
ncbi:hypothetical protein LOTGIDRAFT_209952 [Lottia gigantea]|uniref:Uncharacterized protein n=1 Tax=Lottia gigantea TaxID=225164 RepID=V4BKA8_LOTGI|nr:hypothetical protein LOTGIDRAFT_209952 [Lottia gigantea]ESO89009.1 hypothetical protein LOTGIDRAFT_209952 [Lottia gigantea]